MSWMKEQFTSQQELGQFALNLTGNVNHLIDEHSDPNTGDYDSEVIRDEAASFANLHLDALGWVEPVLASVARNSTKEAQEALLGLTQLKVERAGQPLVAKALKALEQVQRVLDFSEERHAQVEEDTEAAILEFRETLDNLPTAPEQDYDGPEGVAA